MEGWRWLAKMLRGQAEARWNRLPDEPTAKVIWPAFRDAVIEAVKEHTRQQPGAQPRSADTRDEQESG